MENTPLISVIICCYNSEKHVKKCLTSLLGQSYKNLEIIVVNDGSTDKTQEILSEYSNVKLINTQNNGVASARNLGLNEVTGKYFTFIDSDDIVDKNHLQNLYNNMVKTDSQLSVCGIKRIKEKRVSKIPAQKKLKRKIEVYEKSDGIKLYFSQAKLDYVLWNKLYSTEILRKSEARFIDGLRYGEEASFIHTYLKFAEKIVYSKAKTYYYIKQKSSLMNQPFNEKRLDIYTCAEKVLVSEDDEEIKAYVCAFRANYSVGLLYLIKKAKYKNPELVKNIIEILKKDCKKLKKCKKVALYRRVFIPLIPSFAKLVYSRQLRKVK